MALSVCSACRLPSREIIASLPCEECLDGLLAAPAICADCLGFTCTATRCERPWLAVNGGDGIRRFDSVRSAYLSIGPGARVLKSWKTTPNPSLDRFLLGKVRERLADFRPGPLFLVPVPQSATRRWELGGGSTLRLCDLVRQARRNPEDRVLELLEVGNRSSAQAKSRGDERYSRRAEIRGRDPATLRERIIARETLPANPTLVLVDDFLTSGATLRSAAEATRRALETLGEFGGRFARLEIFVLGFRPALFGGGG